MDLLTAELATYDWDDAGRLITTTVAGVVNKVYQYSQDGDLIRAEVDGLVTTFAYDGRGSRLQMSVAGETTTYLPDYGGRSNRILFEQGTEETKQYLYGVACLGEFVTNNSTSDTGWRYYQRDGSSLVRQTTNEAATITLAWTFSPEGGVLMGEEGPVTHLGCGDDAVYDWSTGLIFKGGRYFDPSLGMWLTMGGAVIWHNAILGSRRKGKRQNKKRRWMLIILLLLVVLLITACGPTPTPEPAETATCTPEPIDVDTPEPNLPPPILVTPRPTIGPPFTPTSWPTVTQPIPPINTPKPPTTTPYPGVPTPTISVFVGDLVSWPPVTPFSPSHLGIDIVPNSKRGGGDAAANTQVQALTGGYVVATAFELTVLDNERRFTVGYSHIQPLVTTGQSILAGNIIGKLNSETVLDPLMERDANGNGLAHLHLSLKIPPEKGAEIDPSGLIIPGTRGLSFQGGW